MNICVVATASRESGALSIYKQFLTALKDEIGQDRYLIFVDPSMPRPQIQNVSYITKRTLGFGRIAFDFWQAASLLKHARFRPDVIISFQNSKIRYRAARHIVYFHSLLPFNTDKWRWYVKEEHSLFFYTRLYPHYVGLLLNKNDHIIVQAHFLKKQFTEKFHIPEQNVFVIRANSGIDSKNENIVPYQYEKDTYNFIYPAVPLIYKNHILLAKALCLLRKTEAEKVSRIRIHLTLKHGENIPLERFIDKNKLQQQFVLHGSIPFQELLQMYKSSLALLFPSYIETIGLPQLEAAALGRPVITTDTPFAHEALGGYEGATYLNYTDTESWAKAIGLLCTEPKEYKPMTVSTKNSWPELFKIIRTA